MGPFGFPELIIILVVFLISTLVVAFWVWTLVDCIKNEPSEGNDKVIWILVIALAGWIGSLVYLFARRSERIRRYGR